MKVIERPTSGILIVHDAMDAGASLEAQDTLVQVASVRNALLRLEDEPQSLAVPTENGAALRELMGLRPNLVFNLVESPSGLGETIDRVPRMLEEAGIPYTGCSAAVLRQTSDKLAAKRIMACYGIPTPGVWDGENDGRWIAKSVWEHASLGMDDDCVVPGGEVEALLADRGRRLGGTWFAERYIEGREINVSLLEGPCGPQVLGVAEIDFLDYAPGKPRIVGYAAKWLADSFEYRNTPRCFLTDRSETENRAGLVKLALRCWYAFGLSGYARVDMRIDEHDRPWLLEVNANPCLSPDAGFAAAVREAGLRYDDAIARIVASARRGHWAIVNPTIEKMPPGPDAGLSCHLASR